MSAVLDTVDLRLSSLDVLQARRNAAGLHHEKSSWFSYARGLDDNVFLSWGKMLQAGISADGRSIDVASGSPAGPQCMQSYLFAQILSFPLLRQGLDPLHASVISGPGGAFALLGDSGVGKSTLTAALLRAGARLVSDDLLAVRPDLDWAVLAGPPRLRLLPATAKRVLPGGMRSQRMNPYTSKRVFELPSATHDVNPGPLRALFILELGDRSGPALQVRSIQSAAALRLLVRHTFNPLDGSASRLRRQLETYARIVQSVPVRVVRVQRRLDQLGQAATRLLDYVAGVALPNT